MKAIIGLPKTIIDFFRSVFKELKLIEFPSKKNTFKMTNIVVVLSVLFTLLLLGLDSIFIFLRNYLANL